jgi:hypothetical protein
LQKWTKNINKYVKKRKIYRKRGEKASFFIKKERSENMGLDEKLYYCDKCHRTMSADNFYRSNNLEKYPEDGIMNVCKNCLTMHIDN